MQIGDLCLIATGCLVSRGGASSPGDGFAMNYTVCVFKWCYKDMDAMNLNVVPSLFCRFNLNDQNVTNVRLNVLKSMKCSWEKQMQLHVQQLLISARVHSSPSAGVDCAPLLSALGPMTAP